MVEELGLENDVEWFATWATTCHGLRKCRNKSQHDSTFMFPLTQWLGFIEKVRNLLANNFTFIFLV
jgi:hypothetical protein